MNRHFSDDPLTIWLTGVGPDRDMVMDRDFWFIDRYGKRWEAPKGEKIDGASIPRALWTLVGSPYTGHYRRASIVHDIACRQAGSNSQLRRKADLMFYDACREGECTIQQATILYIGVRIGAEWGKTTEADTELDVRFTQNARHTQMQQEFQAICEDMLHWDIIDDLDLIEKRVDGAFLAYTKQRVSIMKQESTIFSVP
jgi:Protein of unknown function (DUF1353)